MYTALLNGKGRALFEGHVHVDVASEDRLLLDVAAGQVPDVVKHLSKFKLRSKVKIEDVSEQVQVQCVLPQRLDKPVPLPEETDEDEDEDEDAYEDDDDDDEDAYDDDVQIDEDDGGGGHTHVCKDPRVSQAASTSPAHSVAQACAEALRASAGEIGGAAVLDHRCPRLLGARLLVPRGVALPALADVPPTSELMYHTMRLLLGLPEGEEIGHTIPLEWNLNFLNGVSFEKGCYVGQELTARTNFQGLIRKRVMPVLFLSAADADAVTRAEPGAVSNGPDDMEFFVPGVQASEWPDTVPVGGSVVRAGDAPSKVGKVFASVPGTNVGLAVIRMQHCRGGTDPDAPFLEAAGANPPLMVEGSQAAWNVVPLRPWWWSVIKQRSPK